MNDRVLEPSLQMLARGLRFVGELRDLPCGSVAQRRHFLSGLSEIVGAQVGVSTQLSLRLGTPLMSQSQSIGWEDPQHEELFFKFLAMQDALPEPTLPALARIQEPLYVRLRQELVDDQAWYGSAHVQELRKASSIDHCVYGALRSGDGALAFSMNRHWGDKPFRERDSRLIEILFREAAPVLVETTPLPPRQRAVLEGLCRGLSEKQIAAELELSPHTIHGHVKELHRRYGAQSRGELLAKAHHH